MRYLLDTNILIFALFFPDSISDDVQQIIDDYNNSLFVSSESVKEFIHLYQIGKIKKKNLNSDIVSFIEKDLNVSIKYLRKEHLNTYFNLGVNERHNDPSDRIIISQAITEKLTLVSSDRKFFDYQKHGLKFIYNKR